VEQKNSKKPTQKITAVSVGGASSILLIWIAGLFGVEITPEVAAAITMLVTVLSGYLTPDKVSQAINTVTNALGQDETE